MRRLSILRSLNLQCASCEVCQCNFLSVCLLPVTGRGVLAVGLVLAAGGILSRDVPVAGLLK